MSLIFISVQNIPYLASSVRQFSLQTKSQM